MTTMTAEAWIAAQRRQMQEKEGREFWSKEELEAALSDAAAAVQRDIVVFSKKVDIITEPGKQSYDIKEEIIDVIMLKVGGVKYSKVTPARFYNEEDNSPIYIVEPGVIKISPVPNAAEKMEIAMQIEKRQAGGKADLVLPSLYLEAMRRYFLFRVYEKQPDRKSRNLASYYLRLYDKEIYDRKHALAPRAKSARSGYRRV